MIKIAEFIKLFHRDYFDVLGVDIGVSGTKVVRIKRVNGKAVLFAADLLPVISLVEPVKSMSGALPKSLKARYVALATSNTKALIKMLTFPANTDKTIGAHIYELMGINEASHFRVGYEPIHETRSEKRVLAVGLPDSEAHALCGLFPVGIPAPCSIEVSGLSSLTAFLKGPGQKHLDDCVAVMDFGAAVTMVSFVSKGMLVMVRKFDFGTTNILKKLQDNLGVDQDVAAGILSDGSFDVSRIIHQAMEQFLQQLIISWDFVERREAVHIEKLYAGGGGMSLRLWAQEMETATGHKPERWNPFDGLVIQPGAIPDKVKGQESRFAGAVGVALGILKV